MIKPKFQIIKDRLDHLYYYRVKDREGVEVLKSEGLQTKQECLNIVATVIECSSIYANFIRKDAPYSYSFILKSSNETIIGISNNYRTMLEREQAMLVVMRDVPIALVEDLCYY